LQAFGDSLAQSGKRQDKIHRERQRNALTKQHKENRNEKDDRK
jgi:hypothetical protein